MASEVSEYLDAVVHFLADKLDPHRAPGQAPRIPVFARSSGSLRRTEEQWSVEIGVAVATITGWQDSVRAQIACEATMRYVSKSPQYAQYAQALDLAATVSAIMSRQRIRVDHDVLGLTVTDTYGVAVADVQIIAEPETAVVGGYIQPTGAYRVAASWTDELVIEPRIDYRGLGIDTTDPYPESIDYIELTQRTVGEPGCDKVIEVYHAPGAVHFGATTDIASLRLSADDLEVRDELAGPYHVDLPADPRELVPYWAVQLDPTYPPFARQMPTRIYETHHPYDDLLERELIRYLDHHEIERRWTFGAYRDLSTHYGVYYLDLSSLTVGRALTGTELTHLRWAVEAERWETASVGSGYPSVGATGR